MEKNKEIPKDSYRLVLRQLKEKVQLFLYAATNVSLEEMKKINLIFKEVEKCLKIRAIY